MFLFNFTHNRSHRDPTGIYIVAKFGNDWSIFVDARVSNMANFLIQGQTTRTVLV